MSIKKDRSQLHASRLAAGFIDGYCACYRLWRGSDFNFMKEVKDVSRYKQ